MSAYTSAPPSLSWGSQSSGWTTGVVFFIPKLAYCFRKAMLSAPGRDAVNRLRLGRLDLRQVGRELGVAERVGRGAHDRRAVLLRHVGEDGVVLLAPCVVGVHDPPLLGDVLHRPAADRPRGDGRVQRLVE